MISNSSLKKIKKKSGHHNFGIGNYKKTVGLNTVHALKDLANWLFDDDSRKEVSEPDWMDLPTGDWKLNSVRILVLEKIIGREVEDALKNSKPNSVMRNPRHFARLGGKSSKRHEQESLTLWDEVFSKIVNIEEDSNNKCNKNKNKKNWYGICMD